MGIGWFPVAAGNHPNALTRALTRPRLKLQEASWPRSGQPGRQHTCCELAAPVVHRASPPRRLMEALSLSLRPETEAASLAFISPMSHARVSVVFLGCYAAGNDCGRRERDKVGEATRRAPRDPVPGPARGVSGLM